MKNKVVDKQVIKAISIGISALMSLAPTVDVFAEELDTSTGDETPTEESYSNENEASGENSDVGETIS
ncbi:MAG: hypothetical protein J5966_05910, partial [Lachnospiraceae bacterium]|nr:hypothetical protein [Lachnospiraceae bacterium]